MVEKAPITNLDIDPKSVVAGKGVRRRPKAQSVANQKPSPINPKRPGYTFECLDVASSVPETFYKGVMKRIGLLTTRASRSSYRSQLAWQR